ncbi:MAG: 1,4-alpha-glucan branching protein domain-containing protein [Chloroflexota bacterium]|nr:1,4-alpha-glucan branching protein domain-containing protein [Chloroflexota bacterium]
MAALGAFTFVLHSHLPYVRLAGRWPHGEEWIHEAAIETYIPLLKTLYDLKDEGIPFRLNIGLTPVLAEQLADPLVLDHIDEYLDHRIAAAQRDMAHFEAPDTSDAHLRFLAEWYRNLYQSIKTIFHERFGRDLIGAFRRLQDDGYIELFASAATHAYLPLLARDSTIRAQLMMGVRSYERMFGRPPRTVWLPECAYRPAFYDGQGQLRPGLERFLAQLNLRAFYSETHAITGGRPVGVATGGIVGPYASVSRDYVLPNGSGEVQPETTATTFNAYYVSDSTAGTDAATHSGVVVIGRNQRTGQQVWSADQGYPGDFDYREFHRKADTSGLQYWRVTGKKVDLGDKDVYRPDWADNKIDQHAEHYAHLVGDLIRKHNSKTDCYGLVASSYDTELFGHWWSEGIRWLGKVLRYLAADPQVDLVTTSEYLDAHLPTEVLSVPESSWGVGGAHYVWDNDDNRWMWGPIYESETRMATLAERYTTTTADERAVLNQAAREMMLMQSSDWQFQVTTGQARDYAIERFQMHQQRFAQLAAGLETGAPDRALADQFYELDKLFPDIDYRWFAS